MGNGWMHEWMNVLATVQCKCHLDVTQMLKSYSYLFLVLYGYIKFENELEVENYNT